MKSLEKILTFDNHVKYGYTTKLKGKTWLIIKRIDNSKWEKINRQLEIFLKKGHINKFGSIIS